LNTGQIFSVLPNTIFKSADAETAPYDYGSPEHGFSQQDLDNPDIEDPFANADAAATVLDGADGQKYIDKASKCFGIDLKKVTGDDSTDMIWDAIPADEPPNPYDPTKYPQDCAAPTELDKNNWLKVRFFIFDTGIMEGYACYHGDHQSCANDGFDSSGSSPQTTQPASTINTGALFSDSSSIQCDSRTKNLGLQDGYHDGQIVKIRICAVPNISSSGDESQGLYGVTGANGKLIVNSRVSGIVFDMVQAARSDNITLSANSGFRTMPHQQALCAQNALCSAGDYERVAKPGTSNHQMGLAIDFSELPPDPGPVPGNPIWGWLSANAASFGYKNYVKEAWHWSPTGN
jgi:hypothetical protein